METLLEAVKMIRLHVGQCQQWMVVNPSALYDHLHKLHNPQRCDQPTIIRSDVQHCLKHYKLIQFSFCKLPPPPSKKEPFNEVICQDRFPDDCIRVSPSDHVSFHSSVKSMKIPWRGLYSEVQVQ